MEVNQQLRNYVTHRTAPPPPASPPRDPALAPLLVDLEDVFADTPCVPTGPLDRCQPENFDPGNSRYWDKASPLHFSAEGYDEIGKMIYNTLCGQDGSRGDKLSNSQ